MPPDWKPARRRRDPAAVKRAKLADPLGHLHHVVPKGSPYHGDDVDENFLTGVPDHLHDGWHRYELTAQIALGELLEAKHVRYALGRLGESRGREFLQRRYALTPALIDQILGLLPEAA